MVFDFFRGDWDQARALADGFIAETGGAHYMSTVCHEQRALIRLARGEPDAAVVEDLEASAAIARRIRDPQVLHSRSRPLRS